MADEAYALEGQSAADSYLSIEKILKRAADSGADAIHPGYGFLAENAGFARAVIDAGLTWIGPPPAAIDALGDKVAARQIASEVGAPMAPGTDGPVSGVADVEAFVAAYGLPVAIKAAFGGGGRGLKVVHTADQIQQTYESAVREAVAAFGRGECFVERYLERPRHVETQCLADQHGGVVVVSTRDCSLQRRHQKLVEEAPAPFLTGEQTARLYESSKAIMRAAGYVGAGTCEFLVGQDGTVSFLEVNTRLQVEHPVSEEVSGLDLVREMFRIADGQPLGYDDPPLRGHSIEFRVNAEDPGRGFLPAPGTITRWREPAGPGVRVDAGYTAGMTVPAGVRLAARQAHRHRRHPGPGAGTLPPGAGRVRGRRHAHGAPLPPGGGSRRGVHGRAVLGAHPLDRDRVQRPDPAVRGTSARRRLVQDSRAVRLRRTAGARERITVEVAGKRLEVVLPAGLTDAGGAAGTGGPGQRATPRNRAGRARAAGAGGGTAGDALTSPMQGTIVKIVASEGQRVSAGDTVVVLEAMKMEQPLTAHKDGTVTGLAVEIGQTVSAGTTICRLAD